MKIRFLVSDSLTALQFIQDEFKVIAVVREHGKIFVLAARILI